MKKRLILIASIFALAALPSCLKDQRDYFEEPSSTRMDNFLEEIRTTLSSESNGWALDYYPGSAYAGTTFTLEFAPQKVTARHESDPEESATSTYRLTTDDGAVLSFDTYNTILHQYATPSSRLYQAKGGDFEFEIRSLDRENKTITLVGKRSRNICTLRPLTKKPVEYLKAIKAMDKSLTIAAAAAEISGGAVEVYLDNGTRKMTIGRKGADDSETVTVRYILTESTLRFATPFTFQGVTFDELTYDEAAQVLVGSDVTFVKFFPEGYISYEDYLGDYTLYYSGGDRNFKIKLVEDEAGRTFKMEGLSTYFQPILGFNGGRGRLTWDKQTIGGSGSLEYILAPWDTGAGYLTWMEGVGMIGYVDDNSVQDFIVRFQDNGVWENYKASGWLLWTMDGDSSAGSLSSWSMASGSYQLAGPIHIQKKP